MKRMTGKAEIFEVFLSSPAIYLLIPSELPKCYVTLITGSLRVVY